MLQFCAPIRSVCTPLQRPELRFRNLWNVMHTANDCLECLLSFLFGVLKPYLSWKNYVVNVAPLGLSLLFAGRCSLGRLSSEEKPACLSMKEWKLLVYAGEPLIFPLVLWFCFYSLVLMAAHFQRRCNKLHHISVCVWKYAAVSSGGETDLVQNYLRLNFSRPVSEKEKGDALTWLCTRGWSQYFVLCNDGVGYLPGTFPSWPRRGTAGPVYFSTTLLTPPLTPF